MKYKLGKCFACFAGYTKCKPSLKRIPRKAKKKLKSFSFTVMPFVYYNFNEDLFSCDLQSPYKYYKKLFYLTSFIQKNQKTIELIKKTLDGEAEILITRDGKLGWYWEQDDDFCPTSGVMPFAYNKEDAGKTWAYSEMHTLWHQLYKNHKGTYLPNYIKSDKDLFNYIKNNPIPENWFDED